MNRTPKKPKRPDSAFAKTWDGLAEACNVDRRTLTNARKNFGKLCPKDRPDGRKEIAAWIAFLDEKGIRGRGINNPAVTPESYIDERQLRLRTLQHDLEKSEFNLAKAKESMLPVAEFEAALSATVSAFITAISQVPGRASLKIVARVKIAALDMLRGALTEAQFTKVEPLLDSASIDYGEIQQIIDTEIEHARRVLAQCDYLNAPADTAAAQCPSPKTARPAPDSATSAGASSAESSRPPSRRRRAKSSGRSSKK